MLFFLNEWNIGDSLPPPWLPVLLSPIRWKYLPQVHKHIGKEENDPMQAHTSYTPLIMILYKFKNKFRKHNNGLRKLCWSKIANTHEKDKINSTMLFNTTSVNPKKIAILVFFFTNLF